MLPPQYISDGAVIERCIICNGSEIYGEVRNSVLGSNVIVEEGAVVRDSIIMQDCVIGKGCVIDHSILAEDVKVGENSVLGVGDEAPNTWKPDIYSFGLVTVAEHSVIPEGVRIGKNTAISGVTVREDYVDGELRSGESLVKAGDQA